MNTFAGMTEIVLVGNAMNGRPPTEAVILR
jgi:hypothetical protein